MLITIATNKPKWYPSHHPSQPPIAVRAIMIIVFIIFVCGKFLKTYTAQYVNAQKVKIDSTIFLISAVFGDL